MLIKMNKVAAEINTKLEDTVSLYNTLLIEISNFPGFLDSPQEALPFQRSIWGWVGGRWGEEGGGKGGGTVVGM